MQALTCFFYDKQKGDNGMEDAAATQSTVVKLSPQQYAQAARDGLTRAKDARQERFLELYNVRQTLRELLDSVGIKYTAFYKWLRDPEFKAEYEQKRREVLNVELTEIEDITIKAAKGDIYTETTYYDADGQIKQSAKYQQQPSYKHAELMLKAHKPDVYGQNDAGAGGQVTINLTIKGGSGDTLQVQALDQAAIRELEIAALATTPHNEIDDNNLE